MAPVTATALGMAPQTIDDPNLKALMDTLNAFQVDPEAPPIEALVQTLAGCSIWRFEEQADLYEWIPALNAIDAALCFILRKYPSLLLVAPVPRKNATTGDAVTCYAQSVEDTTAVPEQVTEALCTLLRFLSNLLRHATNKSVFNSIDEMADLLGAADDTVAALALEVLSNVATPPSLHKQQAPEMNQHSTALHTSKTAAHRRLVALARGWGTRGSGLGLFACVTADDSERSLPTEAGEVHFDFFSEKETNGQEPALVNVRLTAADIHVPDDRMDIESSKQKRRKVGSFTRGTRSTAELFFTCVAQAGGRARVPEDRLFHLLADIRLAKAFHSSQARVTAVENRLRALITILHAHPSQEIMSGYFQAQPELCVELIDLLRPTVSSASVSAAAARPKHDVAMEDGGMQAISALANSPRVPYVVRSLAVESLTALVARRDGASGGLTGVARQSNVLSELGVGKGLYLGLLPTLIRYSLASLSTFLTNDENRKSTKSEVTSMDVDTVGMDIGLAFVKATKPPALPPGEQLRRALEFVDSVLTLASSVVSAPSGTAALTDCGLIPALLSTVAIDSAPSIFVNNSLLTPEEVSHAQSLLRFITSQAVQIIEGAIVTHNNALSAFHDLHGVDVLASRLSVEIEGIRGSNPKASDESALNDIEVDVANISDGEFDEMAGDFDKKMAAARWRSIHSSQRVLLFSIVNCLTVVFHQESAATAATSPLGGTQLRRPELTNAVKEILEHVDSYGGVLAALTSSLLSDVMNSEPQVVHHVHGSGIGKAFLRMVMGDLTVEGVYVPSIPPVPELIMAIPNVLSALSLTEDGANALIRSNPFPALLSLFYNPDFAMPKSRCLLNEMTAIVGTGLDEIMRHVPRHGPLVINAVVNAMEKVVKIGSKLAKQEERLQPGDTEEEARLEQERTCLMQYATNFGQMLEQILHNEDHCEPFVKAGGLDAILNLFPYLMPTGTQFLAHVSCLSCPSVCTLTHSTTEDTLTVAFKCIALHYNPHNLIVRMMEALGTHLDFLDSIQRELREQKGYGVEHALSAEGMLEYLPRLPLHAVIEDGEFLGISSNLSKYLRGVITLQWLSNLFAGVIRAASQRSQEMGTGWGRTEREWKKDLSSPAFEKLLHRLSLFYQSSILEVCRIRAEDGFESRDRQRMRDGEDLKRVRYRLRIVCQEGAVVRDGIEIDSCASVGSMEMGEIAEAFDRCVNSSGVMRYRTRRGWVSELTRGHGREPIAEVLKVWIADDEGPPELTATEKTKKRVKCGIADLSSVGASILARLQNSYGEIFSSLSRVMVQSFKGLPVRTMSYESGTIGRHVKTLIRMLSSNIQLGFNKDIVVSIVTNCYGAGKSSSELSSFPVNDAGVSMYLGSLLDHVQACLFEEKRERRMVNVPLLISLLNSDDNWFPPEEMPSDAEIPDRRVGFLQAIKFVFRKSLSDFQASAPLTIENRTGDEEADIPRQCVSRSVAASLPPSITLVRRLISSSLISSSTLTSILSRISDTDRSRLFEDAKCPGEPNHFGWIGDGKDKSFKPDYFTRALQCTLADAVGDVWRDPRIMFAPAHIIHPVSTLAGELIASLEASKAATKSSQTIQDAGQWGLFSSSRLRRQREDEDENAMGEGETAFEPSEAAISYLQDMGFSREHALDALENTRSNRLEVAMEYALSHGQVSVAELERRRSEREERRRRSAEGEVSALDQNDGAAAGHEDTTNTIGGPSPNAPVRDEDMADSESKSERPEGDNPEDADSKMAKNDYEKVAYLESAIYLEGLMTKRLQSCLSDWIESAPHVAFNIIENVAARRDGGKEQGDADAEAVTVVLCSFVLDLCQRYSRERTRILSFLLDRLKSHFTAGHDVNEPSYSISPDHACIVASLCHATVLCTRALPRTRTLVLQYGLVNCLVSSIQTFLRTCGQSGDGAAHEIKWPIWLAPSLLMLDVMAQPMTAFFPKDYPVDEAAEGEELSRVREEHMEQAAAMAKTANEVFSSVRALELEARDKSKGDDVGVQRASGTINADVAPNQRESGSTTAQSENKEVADTNTVASGPFSSVPPYFPLLPLESAEACVALCLDLLGKGSSGKDETTCDPPPGVVQAVLFLLTRLLRSPKLASQSLRLGAAELILSLPRSCRFNGNAGVVTIILRRLLEDEATLQTAMETEIRSTVIKLHGKHGRQGAQDETPRVLRRSFVEAVTPLICRDPATFLKAAATSVCIDSKESENFMVILLSPEQRARNARALADVLSAHDASASDASDGGHRGRASKALNATKSQKQKSSVRGSSSKQKKSKRERTEGSVKKSAPLNGSPSNHITCLLIARAVSLATLDVSSESPGTLKDSLPYGESSSFLWLADVLEILSDLVLAVPACAAAIHRYRPSNSKERFSRGLPIIQVTHALSGCASPPRTFVNLLLHSILPQDRTSKKDQQIWEQRNSDDESAKARKKAAHMKIRVAQSAARLLVALVARAGEGRRRVIADLAFALSGGRLGQISAAPPSLMSEDAPDELEFHALQSWGDLCIGLAAPRSNGMSHDNISSLSFEVVKLMLDIGMAHALMYSVQRLRLQHPMAASTCASLLVPLEVFTRGSVSDSVQAIADKETKGSDKRSKQPDVPGDGKAPRAEGISETTASVSAGTSQRSEAAFADDAMLEDGFDAETAAQNSRSRDQRMAYDGGSGEENENAVAEDEMMVDGADNAESGSEIEIEMGEVDDSDDLADSDDEEISSDGDSDVTEEIDGDSEDETDEDDDDDDDDDDGSEESEDDGIDEEFDDVADEDENNGWDEDNTDDFLDGNVEDGDVTDGGGMMGQGESDLDEGWTAIESSGFGGMLLGTRRNGRAPGSVNARTRGFIDAAEAMIGTLLRTGDIQGDALAEIEGTLGIRIMPQHRGLGEFDSPTDLDRHSGLRATARDTEAISSTRNTVGTLPHVHQRSPPDTGYTAIGGGGRWNEISSMEYVYGGPSVAAGSRNYDLSSARPRDEESDSNPQLSQVDAHLFPGGPAAATHSRAQQSLHPLLCGVDLPPVNALVSDLLPQGIRATRSNQLNSRRVADRVSNSFSSGGYLVSTSTGNVLRVNRGMGVPLADFSRGTSATRNAAANGLVGWTDDGLPFDGTIGDFSLAFERALGESMLLPPPPVEPVAPLAEAANVAEEATLGAEQSREADGNVQHEDEEVATGSIPGNMASSESYPPVARDARAPLPADAVTNEDAAQSGSPSDGDGVASSLAAGLRLSPASEMSASSDQMMSTENPPEATSPQGASTANAEAATDEQPESSSSMQEGEPRRQSEGPDTALDVAGAVSQSQHGAVNENELVCPPGMDEEVFSCLPVEMQREVVEQHRAAAEVAEQLDSASGLDPEALAALPDDMRQEVIDQEQRERRLREQAPADPSNAEEMDNASFIASLAPDLREEILMQADEAFLNSLPPNIIAEAQILRERATIFHRRASDDPLGAGALNRGDGRPRSNEINARNGTGDNNGGAAGSSRRKVRTGKMRLECDRSQIVYLPAEPSRQLSPLMGYSDLKALIRLMYLRSPVRPQRLLQKLFQNLCSQDTLRNILLSAFIQLLNDNSVGSVVALQTIKKEYTGDDDWRKQIDAEFPDGPDGFPPTFLIGAAPEVFDTEDFNFSNVTLFKRRQGGNCAASIAANLPTSARGSNEEFLPPVVATSMVDTLFQLSKTSPRVCVDALTNGIVGDDLLPESGGSTCFDKLLDLLEKPRYAKSSTNLEQLLNLIEIIVTPLSALPKDGDEEHEISQRDIDAAASSGKEWVYIPRIAVSQSRLQLLCSILRMESCRDAAFTKVNAIARRLCRVEANRGYILGELGAVAQALATDAVRDLRTLNIRMQDAVSLHQHELAKDSEGLSPEDSKPKRAFGGGSPSSSVTLSISSSELKLLRVLQTLQSLCADTSQEENGGKKNEGNIVVTDQLVEIFQTMNLDDLWAQLNSCLHVVKVLEGVTTVEEIEEKNAGNENDGDDASDDNGSGGKKLQNSVAGLLTRFLPIIEAFFVVNASARSLQDSQTAKEKPDDEAPPSAKTEHGEELAQSASTEEAELNALVGGKRVIEFVTANRVLLNALIRNNPGLVEKGLRAMVQEPRCRALLDFDVKRHWFKTQVRRLRQHASRRHGSLRLGIRRKHVFEDAYHQLRLRNAEEMRGRLHITFRNEEGVDAGGLSREFFGILAKEIFNPNYALFTSTEDGCTFQPNPNSSINPDHLSYFRFVGRIVGKAVADGFLLDAHFTRSLYKHMLGLKPTYHDMEAIDPDYYKNLQMILEYKLVDIGLDLTFSIEDYSFGRSQIIDLLPNGRNIPVTEETKAEYVSLVCQHRMTTAISSQIKAYLDGFYELVSRDLIAIFTPRELELLISGLPDIDVHDLRQNTEYQGYKATDKEIQWFWNVMFSLSRSEKAAFLQFVTGSSKVPLSGFAELQGMRGVQKFSIHKAGGSGGSLMSAHTCFNSLDLPVYSSEEEMREKLLYSISEGGGAFLFA